MGQWTTFTEPTLAAVPQSGCVWLGRWVFGTAGSGSGLYGDVVGNYQDLGANPIVVSYTTAWVKTGALQGFRGRLRSVYVFGLVRGAQHRYPHGSILAGLLNPAIWGQPLAHSRRHHFAYSCGVGLDFHRENKRQPALASKVEPANTKSRGVPVHNY